METDRQQNKKLKVILSGIGIFSLIMLVCLVAFTYADETVTVICYYGNPEDNDVIGEVDVFNTESATNACNSLYYDCRNNCIGCYIGSDGEEYCYERTGNKFKR